MTSPTRHAHMPRGGMDPPPVPQRILTSARGRKPASPYLRSTCPASERPSRSSRAASRGRPDRPERHPSWCGSYGSVRREDRYFVPLAISADHANGMSAPRGRPNALPSFLHCRIGQPDDVERRQAAADVHLDVDGEALDAAQCTRAHERRTALRQRVLGRHGRGQTAGRSLAPRQASDMIDARIVSSASQVVNGTGALRRGRVEKPEGS